MSTTDAIHELQEVLNRLELEINGKPTDFETATEITDPDTDDIDMALRWSQVGSEVLDLAWTLRDLVGDIFPLLPDEPEGYKIKTALLSIHHRLETLHYDLSDTEG